MLRRGQFGNTGLNSFALSPYRVMLCALVCRAVQSPILSIQKQAQVFTYVIRQLRGENGVVEKTLSELKSDLEMEENEGLSPTSAQKKHMIISSTLRQVNN